MCEHYAIPTVMVYSTSYRDGGQTGLAFKHGVKTSVDKQQ